MNTAYIKMNDISKSFDGKTIVEGLSFDIAQGDIVGLLGPNGSGKTTTVRLLNGVIRPDKGSLRVAGLDPQTEGDGVRRISGIVTEGAGLYHDMDAVQNLAFFGRLYGVKNRQRIAELLDLFELSEHADKPVGTFSTGMKKRLALAKAMLHEPELLFLDEPTNGLDPEGIRQVIGVLRKINAERGTTILLCSHVLHQLEGLCRSYLFMEQGRIIERGTQTELERKYLKQLKLRVTTGLAVSADTAGDMTETSVMGALQGTFAGMPWVRTGPEQLEFTLPDRGAVSELLRELLAVTWVAAAEPAGRDLETLYFAVRGGRLK
ncbi:ABC transporter ATP-binding protein [Paenibacillus chartarius]|uniref:ABC transporter ATP-binding protein n=1 Tax=Paenibacillus chartarius TaxID=747481 RepID=A0ABV6DSL0_9BACL